MKTPSELCASYLASFATGDVDLVASHVADGFINEHTSALGAGCVGIEEYRRRLPGFISSMPGLIYDVETITAEGDNVWAAYTLCANVNGHPISIRGAMHFKVRGNLIARRVDYWDSQVFKNQAGLA
jgi:predicted ester cyclase